jgi:cytoplasmic iron level regulating protein YaaA (DUF328/UPF0246 family)
MLVLLPPSETKRDGGSDAALDLAALAFPELTPYRKAALAALKQLSRNVGASSSALGLGPTQRFEIDRNRSLRVSPVLPAIERYTGVLYDGLAVGTFSRAQRVFADNHVVIHSALFGLLRAGDAIPAYRVSHDSRLPGLSLRTMWREPLSTVLASASGLILDLRSESYVHLGPAPPSAVYVRVFSENASGRRTALTHFNKKAKGEFVRALIAAEIDHASVGSLLDWADANGIALSRGAAGELELTV